MKRPESEAEALAQSILIWTEIASEGLTRWQDKAIVCGYLLGYEPVSGCPLCEYAPSCDECPVSEWRERSEASLPEAPCTDPSDGSPYARWRAGKPRAAWEMVELLTDELSGLAMERGK